MKRIISVILSVFFIIGAIPGAYAEADSENVYTREILDALDIMSIESNSEFVTRKEFFSGLLYMIYDSFDEEMIRDILVAKGILIDERDNLFAGDRYITYNDAVASVVTILGYDEIARMNGNYPDGYISTAQNIGILKGVTGKRTLSLERESLVNLLYNAINIEPYVMSFDANKLGREIAEGETVLSLERNIYEISGLVEANHYTSLIDSKGNFEDQITINGENYYINGTDAGELLGRYVEGYVQKDDKDDGRVIYLSRHKTKTNEITIDVEYISSVSDDCRSIEYLTEDYSKVKTAKIASKVRVIYNGRFYDQYTKDDFMIEQGNVSLIDNNRDNEYDCVFINAYETMIVDYVNASTYEIYGKYTYNNALNYLKLESNENNPDIHYYLGDEEVGFNEIGKDDIITVQKSMDASDMIANIYISRNVISGKLIEIDKQDGIIGIDDKEYKILSCCIDEISVLNEVKVSDEYNFCLDYLGNVAYIRKIKKTDYCLFYKIYEDEQGIYNINYLNDASEWVTVPLKDKVNFDGVRMNANDVFENLKLCEPQVMIIKCNTSGEVTTISLAKIEPSNGNNFTKTSQMSKRYRRQPNAFDCEIYLESDAKLFIIPDKTTYSKEELSVENTSYLLGEKSYQIVAYDVDEYNFTKAICVKEREADKNNKMKGWLLVDKVEVRLNDDDDAVGVVYGAMGSFFNEKYEAVDDKVFEDVVPGDIIKVGLNNKGKVERCGEIQDSLTTGDFWGDSIMIEGIVEANDYLNEKIKMKRGSGYTYVRCSQSTSVLIYDGDTKSIVAGNTSKIIPGDRIYIRMTWGVPQEVIVKRE